MSSKPIGRMFQVSGHFNSSSSIIYQSGQFQGRAHDERQIFMIYVAMVPMLLHGRGQMNNPYI